LGDGARCEFAGDAVGAEPCVGWKFFFGGGDAEFGAVVFGEEFRFGFACTGSCDDVALEVLEL
jgi:hypothetical protein